MKKCCKCQVLRPLDEFSSNKSRKDGLNPSCRVCHKTYTNAHYVANKDYYIAKAIRWNTTHLDELTQIINEAKSKPCVDCGRQFDPVAMDLDHVRGKKVLGVSEMRKHKMSAAVVRAEIAKCEVRCAVCHRLRTHRKCLSSEMDITQVYET